MNFIFFFTQIGNARKLKKSFQETSLKKIALWHFKINNLTIIILKRFDCIAYIIEHCFRTYE